MVGRPGSRGSSGGSRSERMKPVIREVRGRKLSAGEAIVLGAGGLEGSLSLEPQITQPPAAIVAQWKVPMGGGHGGWRGNSEQWSVGERGLRVTVGGRGFYALISLVCHWRLIQNQLPVQQTECIKKKTVSILFSLCLRFKTSASVLVLYWESVLGVGWEMFTLATRSTGSYWHHYSTSRAKSRDLSFVPKCFKGGQVSGQGVMGLVGRKDQRAKPSSAVGVTSPTQPPHDSLSPPPPNPTAPHTQQQIGHNISGWQLKFGVFDSLCWWQTAVHLWHKTQVIMENVVAEFWSSAWRRHSKIFWIIFFLYIYQTIIIVLELEISV